ncbi:MAG TPA: hypothetical protein VLY24_22095 [Bryobacteraceae bacterium]|nr:hypothetical protein [Bryobacteraceae bacterium]
MNVERTMEFILDAQAKQAASQLRHEARMDAIDKRLNGITKLLGQGMRLLVNVQESQKVTAAELKELAAAQKATEKKLQRLIDIQSRRNGH